MSEHSSPAGYIKIWALLLVLLIVSIVGPMFEIKVLTLITAFGIAIVKAWLVASRFMHLNTEKHYISYMLISMLLFVALFFAGVSGDVMRGQGVNWINKASADLIEKHSTPQSSTHGTSHE